MVNKNRNILSEYIYSLYDKGLMKDYSNNHFLIRAMQGEIDIIAEYGHLQSANYMDRIPELSSTFLINFSNKLHRCAKLMGEVQIENFVKNQLAAGKKNYNEASFFEALSEINVLFYFCNFIGRVQKVQYEPTFSKNRKNVEARFIYDNNTIIDIEVKKANFINSVTFSNNEIGAIKPNVALSEITKNKLNCFCKENMIQLVFPRISKIAEFINSAANKFELPSSNNHFNLLFINWTYTDFPECGTNEPLSILINTENGLLYNNNALSLIKDRNGSNMLKRSDIDKISAIILYQDTLETLLSCDFRFHFKEHTFKYIINNNNEKLDFNLLSKLLGMDPCNDGITCEWYPLDYKFKATDSNKLLDIATNIILDKSVILHKSKSLYKQPKK